MRLFTLFLLLTAYSAKSQNTFAPLGAEWYYVHQVFLPQPPSYGNGPLKLEVTGEETIQGRICRRIESPDWGCSDAYPVLYVYEEAGKVYRFFDDGFYLLYDFTATAGQSWVIKTLALSGNTDTLIVQVDSVTTVVVDGQTLKVQHVSYPNFFEVCMEWGTEIIEGIGNTYFMAPQICVCDPHVHSLRCYQTDSLDLHFTTLPCDTVLTYSATEDLAESPVGSLFQPNPAFTQTVLAPGFSADEIIFYDLLGRKIARLPYQADQSINLSDWLLGTYIAQLFRQGKLVGVEKLWVIR